VFERYYKELLGYFSKSIGDSEKAKDIVQETYLRISAMGERADTIMEPRAFLYKTAKRILIDEWRKNQQAYTVSLNDTESIGYEDEEPLRQILSDDRMKTLYHAIDALPPRCQEAFKLHKFEGFSHKEVAEKMGISKNAVEKLIIRALLACKQSLEMIEKES